LIEIEAGLMQGIIAKCMLYRPKCKQSFLNWNRSWINARNSCV